VAARPVGAGGAGAPGVEVASAESLLWPPPFGPDAKLDDTT
jgi:hypothetical protein